MAAGGFFLFLFVFWFGLVVSHPQGTGLAWETGDPGQLTRYEWGDPRCHKSPKILAAFGCDSDERRANSKLYT
jgi:hypothetical protein